MKIIRSITIVGGGSSAWLSAAYLSYKLPDVKFKIIDKEIGTPIGVGEATLKNFVPFMKNCGFIFEEYFSNIDMTYKLGILFPNWYKENYEIWHPFNTNVFLDDSLISLVDLWSFNQQYPFKTYGTCLYDVAKKNKIDMSEESFYAYHIDCGKLVTFIQNKLKDKIEFIKSKVVSVQRDKENIFSITLSNGNVINSDLYIDCTGFSNILKFMPKRVDLSDRLFCNTAVATHVPYNDVLTEMKPYVTSEAIDIGWVWSIPIQSRIGTGLVFNRELNSIDEAKKRLTEYWKNRVTVNEMKVLQWDPYYNKNFWEGNVVSIGLSAAFIEPLESTGLAFAQYQIEQLLNKIQDRMYNNNDIESYNNDLESRFDECIDFVAMHYSKTERKEPFWLYVKNKFVPSQRFTIIKKLLEESPLLTFHTKKDQIFSGGNWTCWMAQLGYTVGQTKFPLNKKMSTKYLKHYIENIENFRFNHSRDHYLEVQRIKKLSEHSFQER
jgi:tryptophan halogenase